MEENKINETPENKPISDEDLIEVSGGNESNKERWRDVNVKDGPNNSALCPFCPGVIMSYDGRGKVDNKRIWNFHCPKCNKKFIKNVDYPRWRLWM